MKMNGWCKINLIINEIEIFIFGKNVAEFLSICKIFESESNVEWFTMPINGIEDRFCFKRFKQNKSIEYLERYKILFVKQNPSQASMGKLYKLNEKAIVKIKELVTLCGEDRGYKMKIKSFVKENLNVSKIIGELK